MLLIVLCVSLFTSASPLPRTNEPGISVTFVESPAPMDTGPLPGR
ncbi:MAG TPA: hypothetical protein VJO72_06020 [Candidatus Dormibacteraeota bacterium]|nr:hypothetical protein [Candidatus Dormibacteraeota bacterium]